MAGTRATESMKAADVSLENREYWRNEKIAFLTLSSLKGVGFWTLYKLAKSGVSFKEVLKDPEGKLVDKIYDGSDGVVSITEQQDALWQKGLSLARSLFADNIRLIFKDEIGFPPKLRNIPDAPYWIFVQGDLAPLFCKSVAIVGTRQPSDDGVFLSKLVLAALVKFKCVTVSGLAMGVDQLAHQGSLRYALKTIAVLGTGILGNYPKGSEELRRRILDGGGTIVSEYLPHQSYSAENFIRRNRLQAALCDLLVPVEWGIKSGTAHTVRFAAKYEKAIVNLYMPLTYNSKPELSYSESQFGAISLEMPREISRLDDCIYNYLSEDLFFDSADHSQDVSSDGFDLFDKGMVLADYNEGEQVVGSGENNEESAGDDKRNVGSVDGAGLESKDIERLSDKKNEGEGKQFKLKI
ncbi:DNA protecting protein DprA [Pseudomonas sp. NFACC42-2]|nr:DNA protecting protein DprA [Pseudomonas sp. NFACC42-2]